MRDVAAELKDLRLLGMLSAWDELMAQGEDSVASSKWLIEHLLRAENTDRAMRSVSHQMTAAKFPVHRDLDGEVGHEQNIGPGGVRWCGSEFTLKNSEHATT